MAGYRKQATVYQLTFKEPEFNGLEVFARSVSIQKLMKLFRLSSLADLQDIRKISPEDVDNLEGLFQTFGRALVKWNLEEQVDPLDENSEWVPVPATPEAVLDYDDMVFMTKIVMAWAATIASVSDDLGKDSTSGQRFPEGSELTAPSSLSLSNLMKLS